MIKNYRYFLWHAFFLAITIAFTEINTVIPSLILKAGGDEILLGFLTSILVGFPFITKFFFAFFLHSRERKKPFLLMGINIRVASLFLVGFITGNAKNIDNTFLIVMIFILMAFFSIGGAFAGISYVDLLGKTVAPSKRRFTMSIKQFLDAIATLLFGFAARFVLGNFNYPDNYSFMFFIAATALLIASGGFWMIKEQKISQKNEKLKIREMFHIIKELNKRDKNLFYYILFLNLSAFSQTTIPFYIAFAKNSFGLSGSEIGNYMIFQIIGMIVATPFWYLVSKKGGFKRVIRKCLILAAITPIYALVASNFGLTYYALTFLFTGFSLSARKIAVEGLLIEITKDDNRALYSGISGAFSIVSAIFPILSGIFISVMGYNIIFVVVALLIITGLIPLSKIKTANEQ